MAVSIKQQLRIIMTAPHFARLLSLIEAVVSMTENIKQKVASAKRQAEAAQKAAADLEGGIGVWAGVSTSSLSAADRVHLANSVPNPFANLVYALDQVHFMPSPSL